ncbi:SAM-dependent methyltransferase [Geodermatophilus bullaregiensis]|uniref:class I SAM-dependent methyltransferase n=1 Tax=Geodermatophilus bullaregiensis TaxID=1564160 RepID=UPI00195B17B2|nr:methyltransferase domain-containing protein [Geodermatophilus bullaregiensis]MBM7804169.1 SAM-dependent methyltransferase [Geodermatophilus bullaregiensis]
MTDARRWPRRAVRLLPGALQRRLRATVLGRYHRPPVGEVDFGDLRRTAPVSRNFGYDRGLPVDRYYIEEWLAKRATDIRGRVLEVGDDSYTRRFGGDAVTAPEVLHLHAGNPKATYVTDLRSGEGLPDAHFDCLVLTQTLHLVYDVPAALRTAYRVLRPGGVLLATFPGISQRSEDEWAPYWCWAFTSLSATRLFHECFPPASVTVESHGNVLAAVSFLEGIAAEELEAEELALRDPSYELLITVRAVKQSDPVRADARAQST